MWCATCDESRSDHPTVCTTCGGALGPRRSSPENATTGMDHALVEDPERVMAMLSSMANAMVQQGGEIVIPVGIEGEGAWEQPPAEAMDPTGGGTVQPKSRPASKEFVSRIPRIEVDTRSSILHETTVDCVPPPPEKFKEGSFPMQDPEDITGDVSNSALRRPAGAAVQSSDAVVGEFGRLAPYTISGRLILADPITGSGGLSDASISSFAGGGGGIVFFERGGNVSFARKALMAQEAGACAVVVGNNLPVWPYVMKDSKGEAQKENLTIPVVMVKRSDGGRIRKMCERNRGGTVRCTIRAKRRDGGDDSGCVVCRENFGLGDTIIRLPFCSHCFHENCALAWLRRHNTCPFCRRELPTDDEEYEIERMRQSRTHAGSDEAVSSLDSWEAFFG